MDTTDGGGGARRGESGPFVTTDYPAAPADIPDEACTRARPAGVTHDQLVQLRELQRLTDEVYGRLEPERAVAWAAEELGEVSSAIRKREGDERLLEEIGQFAVWAFCLANICRVDIGTAVQVAVDKEVDRQVAKYGHLKPYGKEIDASHRSA